MKLETASVIENVEVYPGVHLLWLASNLGKDANPGQFMMVRCSDSYDPLLRRPFSIHRVRYEPPAVALLYAVRGRGTQWLSRRRVGDVVELMGPLGSPFSVERKARNLLMVAGGIGIAPLVFLAERAGSAGRSIVLLLGASTAADLFPTRLLPPEVEVVLATEDGSAGHKGMVTDLILQFIDWADQVFACGPRAMYETMASIFRQHPTRKSVQVCWEEQMGCGLGVCLGCVVETRHGLKRTCTEGAVFDLWEVLP